MMAVSLWKCRTRYLHLLADLFSKFIKIRDTLLEDECVSEEEESFIQSFI